MTHIATLGTSSCATIAIGGFKAGNKELNDNYLANKSSFKEPAEGLTVEGFSSNILMPIAQDLGRTKDYPFERLMEDLEKSSLKNKLVIATLNQSQYLGNDCYWHQQLKKWRFTLFTKTRNEWGSVNYMYIRNPLEVEITKEEAKTA